MKELIICAIVGMFIIEYIILMRFYNTNKNLKKEIKHLNNLSNKHLRMFKLVNCWVNAKIRSKSIADYLNEKNIKSVAIYGLSYIGQSVVEELESSNIKVDYGIDQNPDYYCQKFDVYSMQDKLPEVDIIIVTPVDSFETIRDSLSKKVDSIIISVEEIIEYI